MCYLCFMKANAIDTRTLILSKARAIIAGKSYAAVGLNEILTAAAVPKGSFYHYFASKDQFGEALLKEYFEQYLQRLDGILSAPGGGAVGRLMRYWQAWVTSQSTNDQQQMCLAVKLGGEVSDLSDTMRAALRQGTGRIVERIAQAVDAAVAEGALDRSTNALEVATQLYELWVGASLLEKIHRDGRFFASAMARTEQMLRM